MQHLRPIWTAFFIVFAVSALSTPAHALSAVTWVSRAGSNLNTCGQSDPCATFVGALARTTINGEVKCLDAGDFGPINIQQSVTIDCHDAPALVRAADLCFNIILNTSLANDPAQTVKIRGVTCDGSGSLSTTAGVYIGAAASVFLEDMVITDNATQGVLDARTHGGVLFISNSVIRNNRGPGIVAAATGGPYGASINNVHSLRNGFGIAVGHGNNVRINHSEFSNNGVGIESDAGGQVAIDSSVLSFNSTGLQNGGTMSFSNSDITFNTTAISGPTSSFGNNRIFGNSAPGTPPSRASFK